MRKLFATLTLILTLTLTSSVSAQSWSSLSFVQKLASNPHGCNLTTQYLRADNGRCIDKAVKVVKAPQTSSNDGTDPKGCEPEQYWAAESPHYCIDKKSQASAPAVTQSAPTTLPVTGGGVSGNCESYRYLLEQYPGWNVNTMLYAMQGESSCNPNAIGDQYTINGVYAPSCGLLQVRTLAGRPSCSALQNPAINVQTSYQIFLSQGYGAWSVLH